MTRYKLGVVIAVVLFSWAAGADRADDRRRAALKGIHFFVSRKEPAVKYMMEALRMKDRELANTIYDIQSRLVLRDGAHVCQRGPGVFAAVSACYKAVQPYTQGPGTDINLPSVFHLGVRLRNRVRS